MIKRGGREITEIRYEHRLITYAKQGLKTIYEAILSCFGKGYWIDDAPFLKDDGWKNN